jgi:hypothetical protein
MNGMTTRIALISLAAASVSALAGCAGNRQSDAGMALSGRPTVQDIVNAYPQEVRPYALECARIANDAIGRHAIDPQADATDLKLEAEAVEKALDEQGKNGRTICGDVARSILQLAQSR